ncbi:hypothetical protein [Nocardia sp. NPDC048505]
MTTSTFPLNPVHAEQVRARAWIARIVALFGAAGQAVPLHRG